MKHVNEFKRFLAEDVNLNKNRIKTLTDRVDKIQSFLADSDWKPAIVRFSPQGSWAHETIIKPPSDQGFDADLLVFVSPIADWSAADYVTTLKATLAGSGVYGDKAHLHTRCVRLEYAGDFEIDLVPCVVDRADGTYRYEVCNRLEDEFEATDGEAYTAWLSQRNDWVGNDKLREVTRLLKYLRDIKTTFTCKSILLTTLLGNRITAVDAFQTSLFEDLPTALKTLTGRLDDYLQDRPDLHDISNPVLTQETFTRHWDQDKYSNFREMIHKYRKWIDDAYAETDEAESISKWQRVFDDEWGRSLKARAVAETASAAWPTVPGYRDLVQAVQSAGVAILSGLQNALPWVKPPHWQKAPATPMAVSIRASLHDREGGQQLREVSSGAVLPKFKHIQFQARSGNGMPLTSRDYIVHWQIVNTDQEAARANQLRGGFYRSSEPACHWERTEYRGVHWVQAFVVRKRDGRCVGTSSRFFVVIE